MIDEHGHHDASEEHGRADTETLLRLARAGQRDALETLFAAHGDALRRWASGRLPRWARDLADTPDLVQDTLLDAFKRLDRFEYRGPGALQAYLRQALMNRVRNELRRAGRHPSQGDLADAAPATTTSPLDIALAQDSLERYERALAQLDEDDRALVIGRLELGLTWQQVADKTGRPTANAARMAAVRAMLRLAERIG